jgi:hemolysin III
MIAYRFRQIKKCACSVEKNRSDHLKANVQRTPWLRNTTAAKRSTLTPGTGQRVAIFVWQNLLRCVHDRVLMNAIDESLPLQNWTQSAGEEVANGISHGIGLVGAIIGTPILLLAAFHHGDIPFFVGTIIFTMTMLLVYLASTLYHCWPRTETKSVLQVIDHSTIFLLIAGTYTPFALGPLRGGGRLVMLGIVWSVALFGVIMKTTRGVLRHRRLAMTLYLGTGWIGLTLIRPLSLAISISALLWLIAGGIAYTAGTLFFANERLRYSHFVWHLFVLAGTSCHFAAVFICAI